MEVNEIEEMISEGVDRAKAGEALSVYEKVAPLHDAGSVPTNKHYALGWIIYYAMHQTPDYSIEPRKQMLARYLKLQVPRPHKLHSMILTQAIRLYKDAQEQLQAQKLKGASGQGDAKPANFSIVRFLPLWGLQNLRPGDWRRKEHEGKRVNATVEKLLTTCVDEYYNTRTAPSEEFMTVMHKGMVEYPDSASLKAQRALLYEMEGAPEMAKARLREALLLAPGKFYLWSRLAGLVDASADRRLKCALYVKALGAPGQENFKGRVRLGLAETLAEGGALPYAKWELEQVERIYRANGWHLPAAYDRIKGIIGTEVVAADPAGFYKKLLPLAEEYLYESLPYIEVEKTYHKDAGATTDRYGKPSLAAWRVTDASGANFWLNPAHHNLPDALPQGARLRVKLFSGKVVKVLLP